VSQICLQRYPAAQLLSQKWTEADGRKTVARMAASEARAPVALREKHGELRQWGDMLVIF
jgi:hypothetical protein